MNSGPVALLMWEPGAQVGHSGLAPHLSTHTVSERTQPGQAGRLIKIIHNLHTKSSTC